MIPTRFGQRPGCICPKPKDQRSPKKPEVISTPPRVEFVAMAEKKSRWGRTRTRASTLEQCSRIRAALEAGKVIVASVLYSCRVGMLRTLRYAAVEVALLWNISCPTSLFRNHRTQALKPKTYIEPSAPLQRLRRYSKSVTETWNYRGLLPSCPAPGSFQSLHGL